MNCSRSCSLVSFQERLLMFHKTKFLQKKVQIMFETILLFITLIQCQSKSVIKCQRLLTERSTILKDAFTGHNSQASFSRNMRSSSILDLWYVLKYFTVCVRMESWRSSDALPQNSSPTAINLS